VKKNEETKGRIIATETSLTWKKIADILRKATEGKQYKITQMFGECEGNLILYDNSLFQKMLDRPLVSSEQSIIGLVHSLEKLGFVKEFK